MDATHITLLLQILNVYGPETYKAAVALYAKPTAIVPADFEVLTNTLPKSTK